MGKSTKKRGRPAIKPYIESLIASRVFDDQNKPLEKRTPPKVMAYEIHKELIQIGEDRTPKPSTIEKQISKYRNHLTSPLGLEAPWSLGVSAQPEYGISPEATSALLAVWNYCLAIGHAFTIREARWVARLRPAFDGRYNPTGELFAYAYEYAIRERICKILNKQIDTADLDAELFIKERERYVYRSLGLIPRITVPYHQREEGTSIAYWEYQLWAKQAATNIAFEHIPKAAKRADEINELQNLFRLTERLPGEQDRIYAALLLFLSKGPKWDTLSTQEYLQILSELKKWVTEVIPSKQPLEYEILDSNGGIEPTDILHPAFLEAVGYEVNTKTKTKEAQSERQHKAKKQK
jgi:hypothetical protein